MTATDEARQPVTRAGRVFYNVALSTALAVGALQMYRVRGGLLTDYGADVFGTAWLYAITRSGRTILQRGRTVSAGSAATIVFVLCVVSEFGQKLHFVPGRYDPYDIAAYAASVVACWMIDYQVPFIGES
jgi:hypothetical protein